MSEPFSFQLHRRRVLLGGLALLPAACGILPDVSEPLKLYTLQPRLGGKSNAAPVTWQLVIATPKAERNIDTARIALTHGPNAIEYFAEGNWADAAPRLVQAKLIEACEAAGTIPAVAGETAGLKPDFVLQSDLRDFQAEYSGDGPPNAHIRLIAKMVKLPDRRIVATIPAEASVGASENTLPAIVTAFESALGAVIAAVIAALPAAA